MPKCIILQLQVGTKLSVTNDTRAFPSPYLRDSVDQLGKMR